MTDEEIRMFFKNSLDAEREAMLSAVRDLFAHKGQIGILGEPVTDAKDREWHREQIDANGKKLLNQLDKALSEVGRLPGFKPYWK